jgi:hypothetical protein
LSAFVHAHLRSIKKVFDATLVKDWADMWYHGRRAGR